MTKIDDGRAEYAKRSGKASTADTSELEQEPSVIEQGRQAWRDRNPRGGTK